MRRVPALGASPSPAARRTHRRYLSRSGLKVMQVQFSLDEQGVMRGSPFSDMLFLKTWEGRGWSGGSGTHATGRNGARRG